MMIDQATLIIFYVWWILQQARIISNEKKTAFIKLFESRAFAMGRSSYTKHEYF